MVGAAAAAVMAQSGGGTGCDPLAQATSAPDMRVTALSGIDLAPVMSLPGVSAASGPYPGVATSLANGHRELGTWIEARPQRGLAVDRPLLLSGAWPRRAGGIVVERVTARRLGLRTGGRVRVSTTRGPLQLHVAGIAATTDTHRTAGTTGLAYAQSRALARVAPERVHASTVFLQLGEGGNASALAGWLARRYPGPQLQVEQGFPARCGATPR